MTTSRRDLLRRQPDRPVWARTRATLAVRLGEATSAARIDEDARRPLGDLLTAGW